MRTLLLAAVLAVLCPAVRATTIVPPTFPELVAEADCIIQGTVESIVSRPVSTARGEAIYTDVTLSVEQCLKGTAGGRIVLTFLGGELGTKRLAIPGVPRFQVGAREILFVQRNGRQLCPLVGFFHGRYRVLRDAASQLEYVARDNGQPLARTDDVGLPPVDSRALRALPAVTATALTPADFVAQIRAQTDLSHAHQR
ncbi:MAG: hypothetical protein NTV51_27285 [Verrucomicrobia bacterium]|nr:hypothetical protein [Verrucomicrobiota bacterium]